MILYRADWLVINPDLVLKNSSLLIEGDRVKGILPSREAESLIRESPEIQVESHHLIFPGFINAHMHQYGLLSHGIPIHGEIRDFEDFLKKFWWPFVEDRIKGDEVLITAKASAAEMIASGVTGFCDTLEAPRSEPGTLIRQAQVIEEIGMRAVLSLESCERIDEANGQFCLDENEKLIRWARENSTLISGIVCTHTTFTCSVPFLKRAAALAETLDAPWQFHLSESRYESDWTLKQFGKRAVHHLEENGLLSPRILASQCVKIDSDEIAILKERGIKPVHMPVSNCEVGGGFSPVPEMLQAGLPVAVGTDGYNNDYLQTLQMAFLVHKSVWEDPAVMPAREVFRMGTVNGAKVLGWEECGSLEVGKKADFVCMASRFPTPLGAENLFDQIIVFGKKEFITHVYCGGKALMRDGDLTTLDQEQVRRDMKDCASRFWKDLGCLKFLFTRMIPVSFSSAVT
jgi:cytosine/adenosine deaminase-related metal-dependent hydrolase